MDTRQWRYFVAVADELHFGRAAAKLHMTQPPLSAQIKRLEAELGFELFERSKRRVQLTPAGEALLPHARRAVALSERINDVAARVKGGMEGRLRLGYVGSALFEALPSSLRSFRRAAPQVRIELFPGSTTSQINNLVEDRIDIGLLRLQRPVTGLIYTEIGRENLVAAIPSDSALVTAPGPIRLSDLAAEPFILFSRSVGPVLTDTVVNACVASGFQPRSAYEVLRTQDMIGFVAAGLGVALVPACVAHMQLEGVTYRELAGPQFSTALALARSAHGLDGPTGRMIDLFTSAVHRTGPGRVTVARPG